MVNALISRFSTFQQHKELYNQPHESAHSQFVVHCLETSSQATPKNDQNTVDPLHMCNFLLPTISLNRIIQEPLTQSLVFNYYILLRQLNANV